MVYQARDTQIPHPEYASLYADGRSTWLRKERLTNSVASQLNHRVGFGREINNCQEKLDANSEPIHYIFVHKKTMLLLTVIYRMGVKPRVESSTRPVLRLGQLFMVPNSETAQTLVLKGSCFVLQ